MPPAPAHHARVIASPWPGVYATEVDSGRHYGRHWHGTYGFGVLDAGAQHSASGRGAVQAYAGDVLSTNPGEVHDGRPLGGPSRRWRMVYLEPAALVQATGAGEALAFTQPVITDALLAGELRRLLARLDAWDASPRIDAGDALACEEALTRCGARMLARHATPAPAPQDAAPLEVSRTRDRLAAALAAPPSLAELAAQAGASCFQLLRRFAQAYGMTPHAWLLQQRGERARGLIARGAPLAQAAAACGFADQSHMTRLFARQFGFTPGALRRALQ